MQEKLENDFVINKYAESQCRKLPKRISYFWTFNQISIKSLWNHYNSGKTNAPSFESPEIHSLNLMNA